MSKEQMDSVMIDLETMATGPNAGVIQVGAMAFDSREGVVYLDMFEVDVDLQSALLLGGEVDASTVQFWRDQGGLQPKRPPKAMRSALTDLASWLGQYPDLKRVWAQGPSFDVAVLEGYYRRAGIPIPWGYSMPRDTRTVYDLAKERGWSKPEGTQAVHTSLEDCRRQIICLMSALNVLRGNPEGESKIG
ncbi:putative ribonuclease T [Bordetella phage LK3]|uniref:Putative ribonuclease T n=1 Tax=Bordetella phage LK3 TaxID=1926943 RepID=A0A2D0W8W4_9CAUD|nr:putative ribonuclease T [Bordetella phage LK3]